MKLLPLIKCDFFFLLNYEKWIHSHIFWTSNCCKKTFSTVQLLKSSMQPYHCDGFMSNVTLSIISHTQIDKHIIQTRKKNSDNIWNSWDVILWLYIVLTGKKKNTVLCQYKFQLLFTGSYSSPYVQDCADDKPEEGCGSTAFHRLGMQTFTNLIFFFTSPWIWMSSSTDKTSVYSMRASYNGLLYHLLLVKVNGSGFLFGLLPLLKKAEKSGYKERNENNAANWDEQDDNNYWMILQKCHFGVS